MKRIKEFWSKFAGEKMNVPNDSVASKINVHKVTSDRLCKLLNQCPICKSDINNHSYALIAMSPLDENANRLLEVIKKHLWSEAKQFQNWEGTQDNILVYALRCASGKIGIITLKDPYEPFQEDSLIDFDPLNLEDTNSIKLVIEDDKWNIIG